MRRLLYKRWFRLSAGLLGFLLFALLASAWYYRIWSWRDLQIYREMSRECHPVWKDLYWGRIQAGQDVEEVIAATDPVRVERYGEYVRLHYQPALSFGGVTITAKRGRLASAWAGSCTWDRTFFNELTPEDDDRYREAYEAHWRPIREKRRAGLGAAADRPGG